MDENMKQFQNKLTELEVEAEHHLLARQQLVENDRLRNGNREALTALRKRARTTMSSVPSPFESMMRGVAGTSSRPLVQEVCNTCGNHNSSEPTWMMFPGTDLFARIPFHAAHTILETGVWPPYSLTIGKILRKKENFPKCSPTLVIFYLVLERNACLPIAHYFCILRGGARAFYSSNVWP
ncbi:hypothetical protein VIGAN_09007100 [Vigna angularis var. angularis]|uniref:Uncharacterized protein n=1 Tax=Vigna angularis var. angularis TaxID=157739 RepID=A0A0S3SVE4_PHAAN|nr:hypothetical protein VIGAN_09007100 [Vigna angularis var. angularis]